MATVALRHGRAQRRTAVGNAVKAAAEALTRKMIGARALTAVGTAARHGAAAGAGAAARKAVAAARALVRLATATGGTAVGTAVGTEVSYGALEAKAVRARARVTRRYASCSS